MLRLFCLDKKPMLSLPYCYSDGFKGYVPFPECTTKCMHYSIFVKIQIDVMHKKHMEYLPE